MSPYICSNMDYQSLHGQDISSFDLTSTHRLPTVSAAQALEDLGNDAQRFISTNIEALDQALNDVTIIGGNKNTPSRPGGLQKGQVVEIWGPPGSGKTTLGIQLATNVLRRGEKVVWVDGFHPVSSRRLHDMVASTSTPSTAAQADNLLYFQTPTLAHLIGLLCKAPANAIPGNTCLIVIDTLSSLVNYAFPKNSEVRQTQRGPGPASRRLQVLQFLISTLQKLAATRDVCVVILSQCATRMQFEHGATLIPAINAGTWEQGIGTRLVLFRDWIMGGDKVYNVHFVGIQKLNGKANPGGLSQVFAFGVQNDGLVNVGLDAGQTSLPPSHLKRKLSQTDFEVADSEGEDYGWEDDDELEMPKMPPQWQGSEDILLGQGEEDDEAQIDEESEPQSRSLEEAMLHLDSDLAVDEGNGSS